MRTSAVCFIALFVALVIWLRSRGVSGQSHDGVHYKSKHLRHSAGTLIRHAPDHDNTDRLIGQVRDVGSELVSVEGTEILIEEDEDANDLQPYMPGIRSISMDVLKSALASARTRYDVFRIFLTGDLPDERIDEIMFSTLPQGLSGLYKEHVPLLQGINIIAPKPTTALVAYKKPLDFSDVSKDIMLSDEPLCENCHHIQASEHLHAPRHEIRSSRLRTESWRRRKRRHKPRSNDKKFMKRCKIRRRTISANIKKCRDAKNPSRCKTLGDRYKKMRRKCKKDDENESIIPLDPGRLPSAKHRPSTTPAPVENLVEERQAVVEQWQLWEETRAETNLLGQCGAPVPEVVRVRDKLGGGDEVYNPSCVLTYRCRRDSGCCNLESQACSPIKSEEVTKTILVAKSNTNNTVHFSDITMKRIKLKNDTECGCVDIPSVIHIPCPHPFILDFANETCKCLHSFSRKCRKILRGQDSLTQTTQRCIKHGECRPLDNCVYGEFDMNTLDCPSNDNTGSGLEDYNQKTGFG